MLVLSLRQPWAWLVVTGKKRIETRSWRTKPGKPIAIHASGDMTDEERALCAREPFAAALAETGITAPDQLPLGQIIGRANLEDCIEMGTFGFPLGAGRKPALTDRELAFGKYEPGRWAWMLSNDVLYAPEHRIRMRGMPGLWKVDGDVLLGRAPVVE